VSEPVLVIDVAHAAWHAVRESTGAARPFAALEARIAALAAEHPRCVLALDSPPYARAQLLPSYKQRRTADPEARALVGTMLDGLRRSGHYVIAEHHGAEADDVCATIVRYCHEHGIPCTVATSDKDLAPLLAIAQVWDLRTGAPVTAETVRARWGVEPGQLHDLLALAGDTSDGIPGVPEIGEKRAAVLLGSYGSLAALLAEPPIGESEIADKRREVERLKRAAKRAEDARDPEAPTHRALADAAAQALGVALLSARVHAHRDVVELARKLVALDDAVPIDVAALLTRCDAAGDPDLLHAIESDEADAQRAIDAEKGETMHETKTEIATADTEPPVRVALPLAIRPPDPAPPVQALPVSAQRPQAMTLAEAMASIPAQLAGALVDAQSKVQRVAKDSTNTFHRYRYAAAEEMIDEARGALNAAGLALMSHWKVDHSAYTERDQHTDRGSKTVVIVGRVVVSYTLIHRSGEALRWITSTPIIPEAGRPEDKAEMAALTANLGYTLRQLLLIPRGDEDGGMDQRDDRNRPIPPPQQRRGAA